MPRILQHQARPSVPFIKAPQTLGWLRSFDTPLPARQLRVDLHTTTTFVETAATVPPTIAGIAWLRQFEPPRFKAVTPVLDKSTFIFIPPAASTIAGMAWHRPFEPPFPAKAKLEAYRYEAYPPQPVGAPPIAGMAWHRAFDQPSFKQVAVTARTETLGGTPTPVGISGMAWQRQFDEPRFKPVGPIETDTAYIQQVFAYVPTGQWAVASGPVLRTMIQHQARPGLPFYTAPPPTSVSGMAWASQSPEPRFSGVAAWMRHGEAMAPPLGLVPGMAAMSDDQPLPVPKHAWLAPVQGRTFLPPAFQPTPISGIAWNRPYDQPFFPTALKVWLYQKETPAPPLAMIPLMAAMSDDQPLSISKQFWLAPTGPALVLSPANVPAPISGMAWMRPFDQPAPAKAVTIPRFESYVIAPSTFPAGVSGIAWHRSFDQPAPTPKTIYSRNEAFVPISATLPPQIAGMAWWAPFEQPAPRKPVVDLKTEAFVSLPLALAGVSGMAWHRPFEPPLFPTTVRTIDALGIAQTPPLPPSQTMAPPSTSDQPQPVKGKEAWLHPPVSYTFLAPFTPISGMAWHRPYDEPPPRAVKVYFLPGDAFLALAATLPTPVSGMAWWRPTNEPPPRRPTIDVRMESYVALASTLPPGIAGIAWLKAFEQPAPTRPHVEIMPTEFFISSPATLPVGISGMAWQRAFSEPAPKTPHVEFFDFGEFPLNKQPNPAPIRGIAWNRPYDQPKTPPNQAWEMAAATGGYFSYARARSNQFQYILLGIYDKRR